MQLNIKMLEDKVKKVEAEVVDLREVIRKAISQEVDLDELAASIVSHAVTEEDSTEIFMKMRRLSLSVSRRRRVATIPYF